MQLTVHMYTKYGNNTFNCLWRKTKIAWGFKGIKVFRTDVLFAANSTPSVVYLEHFLLLDMQCLTLSQ
jgi:hypothetical protein